MILEQIAAATRLRLIEEKKLVSPGRNERKSSRPCKADETFPFEKNVERTWYSLYL